MSPYLEVRQRRLRMTKQFAEHEGVFKSLTNAGTQVGTHSMRRIPHESGMPPYKTAERRIDGMNRPFSRVSDEGYEFLHLRTAVLKRVQDLLLRGWHHPLVCGYLDRTRWDGMIGTVHDDIDLKTYSSAPTDGRTRSRVTHHLSIFDRKRDDVLHNQSMAL